MDGKGKLRLIVVSSHLSDAMILLMKMKMTSPSRDLKGPKYQLLKIPQKSPKREASHPNKIFKINQKRQLVKLINQRRNKQKNRAKRDKMEIKYRVKQLSLNPKMKKNTRT